MKERIKQKLEQNIERILAKEELDRFDVALLQDEVRRIETETKAVETKENQQEIIDLFAKTMVR